MWTFSLRVQVPNYKVSTQNHNYDSKYGNPTYSIFGSFGPFGLALVMAPVAASAGL